MKKIGRYALIAIFGVLTFKSIALADKTCRMARFRLDADKQTYEIGEVITLTGFIKNLSPSVVYIQTLRPFLNTKLTITTPKSKDIELIDDRGPFVPSDYSAILPGEERDFFRLELTPENREEEGTASLAPFAEPGTYKLRLSYHDPAPLLKKAVRGTYQSNTIKINIVSFEDMQKILAGPSGSKNKTKKITGKINVNKKEAKELAAKYIKTEKAYEKKDLIHLFISDDARDGYWLVGFEEKKTGIFHAIKVDSRTGDTEEAYFID